MKKGLNEVKDLEKKKLEKYEYRQQGRGRLEENEGEKNKKR